MAPHTTSAQDEESNCLMALATDDDVSLCTTVRPPQSRKPLRKNLSVFLYVPNIIDYFRLLFLGIFCHQAFAGDHVVAAGSYVISVALDELDGNFARWLNQTSEFGMLLDILIDEASVTALCMVLATLYPAWLPAFQALSIIDFAGQWSLYYFSGRYRNGDFRTHDNKLFNIYFNNRVAGDFWVYGNHLFLISIYMAFYSAGPTVSLFGHVVSLWPTLAYLAAPFSISRLVIMIALLVTQMYHLGRLDQEKAARVAKQRGDVSWVGKQQNEDAQVAKQRGEAAWIGKQHDTDLVEESKNDPGADGEH
ncbi:CDP-diacylglycerol--inositol 3-phosphatidyltransferase-like [Mya arenaria]|uniref:CDP-diacylglycerol--inositol 3-phosphatidyltransferase-like n=1 Tax=Mya arenaria TaxID=6604 RepID=UPI0022DEA0E1|nr:CDP-diacylglycerol--inositol 3-phosphatidyltransferase-like [Mya arenaria]